MSISVYDKNTEFLKSKGLVLKGTGAMFMPYDCENETYYCQYDEYAILHIRNKLTGERKSVCIATDLLTDSDFL